MRKLGDGETLGASDRGGMGTRGRPGKERPEAGRRRTAMVGLTSFHVSFIILHRQIPYSFVWATVERTIGFPLLETVVVEPAAGVRRWSTHLRSIILRHSTHRNALSLCKEAHDSSRSLGMPVGYFPPANSLAVPLGSRRALFWGAAFFYVCSLPATQQCPDTTMNEGGVCCAVYRTA